MRKNHFYRFLLSLGLFGLSIDGGESGGNGGESGGNGGESGGNGGESGGNGGESGVGGIEIKDDDLDGGDTKALVKRLQDLEEKEIERSNQSRVDMEVSRLQESYKTFDPVKVKSKLDEIEKTNPDLAAAYNNPAGWEAIHLKHFEPREVNNDEFDAGKDHGENFDFEESLEKARGGDTKSLTAMFKNSVSTGVKQKY